MTGAESRGTTSSDRTSSAVEARAASPVRIAEPRSDAQPLPRPLKATPSEAGSFEALGVAPALVAVLARQGITAPFPIQVATLPDSLAGRDVLGRGKTGSGKTLAFALPVVATLAGSGKTRQAKRPRALLLVPTRELASQVAATLSPLAEALGLRTVTIFGGVGQAPQVRALTTGVDIVVACPGRLEDLIGQGYCRLDAVEITVLDEADHMADLGFLPAVKRLLDQTPQGTQRLLFSATLDNGVDVLIRRYLHDPAHHAVDPADVPVAEAEHHVWRVSLDQKSAVVHELASGHGRSLLFTRTKHGAKKLAKQLTAAGIPAVDLHGNLSQNARERNLAAFSEGSARVLVATDIAARGIHVDDVALVVHVDPPSEHKAYTHRSGRTARAGAAGTVVTISTPDQADEVRVLTRQAGIKATPVLVGPGAPQIGALSGPAAPRVTPPPAAPEPVRVARSSASHGSRGRSSAPAGRSGGARRSSGSGRRGV